MGQQAIVARTGFDEVREGNKQALNARLNIIELNKTSNARVPCPSVCLSTVFRLLSVSCLLHDA